VPESQYTQAVPIFSVYLSKGIAIPPLGASLAQQEELNHTLFHTYAYLVKANKPVGPRDLMRGANLSSPSVAYRNLQRLIDMDLVAKDTYGNYIVKKKVGLSGYFWFGRRLVPRFAVFAVVFVGVLVAEIAILIPHLLIGSPVEESFWLLTAVTVASAAIFLYEGLRFKNKTKLKQLEIKKKFSAVLA
jgi:hypothetical protein